MVKRIVIVEDNDNVAKLIAKALSEEGFETKVISFGSAAVFYVLENSDSLLLMEYQLPDMTAKEVINNLKDNQKEIPFIIMSPPGNEKAIIDMMKLGARDYLVKEQGFWELLPAAITKIVQQLETERRLQEAERNLKASEDKFENIFNSITDAIFIYNFDGTILTVNEAACNLLGLPKEELVTTPYLRLHPEDFGKNFALYLAELRVLKSIKYETEYTDNAGDIIPVECISRLINYENNTAILTIAHNIVERKNTEVLLRLSEERLQRITNTMTDYIYTVFVEDGKPQMTVHSSACHAVTGYTPEEFTLNTFLWIDMVDEGDREFVLNNIKRILNGEQIKPFEHRISKKDGSIVWLRNTPVLHFNEQNQLISYDGVIQDITERKKTEVELLEKQAQLTAIIEAFEGLIYVCSSDYKIEYMNEKFIKRTGYNPVGELCYQALHNLDKRCPWCVNERVQNGETVKWEVQSPKDNLWYSIVNTPIYHYDGRISKQSMIIDITDEKNSGQEAHRFKQLYNNLLAEMNCPVCRFGSEGTILSANKAFETLFNDNRKTKLKGREIFSVIPDELSSWTREILPTLNTKQSIMKLSIENSNAKDVNLQNKVWIIMAIHDSGQKIVEFQSLLKDTESNTKENDLILHKSKY
jgi:PAS domain S-box-containing protein